MNEIEIMEEKEKMNEPNEPNALFLNNDLFIQGLKAAELLSKSEIIPAQYRGKDANCFVALAAARQLGVDVFSYMQSSYVIAGKPAIEAKLAVALVNSRGPFDGPIRYKMEGEGDNRQCTAYARLKGSGEECSFTVTWKMVVAEGWNRDKKSKTGAVIRSKWNTLPDLMFRYRAATYLARTYCPEVLNGLTTTEELQDVEDIVSSAEAEVIEPNKTPVDIDMSGEDEGKEKKEEGRSKAKNMPDDSEIRDKFNKIFLWHKRADTKKRIQDGLPLLMEKYGVSEIDAMDAALANPDIFLEDIDDVLTNGVTPKKEETVEEKIVKNAPPESESDDIDLDGESAIDIAMRTAREEKEKALAEKNGKPKKEPQEPQSNPGYVKELNSWLDNLKPEMRYACMERIKSERFPTMCQEDRDKVTIHYNELMESESEETDPGFGSGPEF